MTPQSEAVEHRLKPLLQVDVRDPLVAVDVEPVEEVVSFVLEDVDAGLLEVRRELRLRVEEFHELRAVEVATVVSVPPLLGRGSAEAPNSSYMPAQGLPKIGSARGLFTHALNRSPAHLASPTNTSPPLASRHLPLTSPDPIPHSSPGHSLPTSPPITHHLARLAFPHLAPHPTTHHLTSSRLAFPDIKSPHRTSLYHTPPPHLPPAFPPLA